MLLAITNSFVFFYVSYLAIFLLVSWNNGVVTFVTDNRGILMTTDVVLLIDFCSKQILVAEYLPWKFTELLCCSSTLSEFIYSIKHTLQGGGVQKELRSNVKALRTFKSRIEHLFIVCLFVYEIQNKNFRF